MHKADGYHDEVADPQQTTGVLQRRQRGQIRSPALPQVGDRLVLCHSRIDEGAVGGHPGEQGAQIGQCCRVQAQQHDARRHKLAAVEPQNEENRLKHKQSFQISICFKLIF